VASESIDDFVASLAKPRTAIVMVQAGPGTDAVIEQLAERFEPGDIIVEGGNANFHDIIRREQDLRKRGAQLRRRRHLRGEEGALRGPSIMPGGYDRARPAPPPALLDLLTQVIHLPHPALVVDVGSGTGLSTAIWGERAERVIGIEPNADMRKEAVHKESRGPSLRGNYRVSRGSCSSDGPA
jgi:6-phosphogluconate dehydrogenase (decarboxylating)